MVLSPRLCHFSGYSLDIYNIDHSCILSSNIMEHDHLQKKLFSFFQSRQFQKEDMMRFYNLDQEVFNSYATGT